MSDDPQPATGAEMFPSPAAPLVSQDEQLSDLEQQVAAVQERIRQATAQRAEVLSQGDANGLAVLDTELAHLRQQRLRLQDEQLRLQRARVAPARPLPGVEPQAVPGSRQPIKGAQGAPPLAVRLAALLLVLAGVGALSIGGLLFVFTRLQPPPIEEIADVERDGVDDDFSLTEGQTFEQRGLAIYLALNRDRIRRAPSDDPTPVSFRVEPGENATQIAQRLEEAGLVEDAELFRRLLQYRGADQQLEVGTFELARNMTMDEIILALQEGRLEEVTFTLPEGWRAEQMAAVLEEQGLVSAEEYVALVQDPSRFNDYDFLQGLPLGSTLEGYLFPDTYSVIADESDAENIIRLQLDNFGRRVTPELREAVAAQGLTLHQAVTLASIVEREAVVAEERETIAGVYLNRLRDGTVLNADPTIQYALGFQEETGEWWKRPLTREDLQLDSPYNTYVQPGLPPGPIASPGLDTIRATILAPETEFYYFVSRNDGTHVFAVTFEEHLQNVELYQSGN